MPIAALSDAAARAISSTLVLNDAISVIKELIDNALDSNATNITIEISANTLDIIQIKDNGGGIGVEDRQLLCKRGFTSKIRTFDDLTQLGGTFLGFRGEALASIAELSDNVTFTTRIDGETVGTLLRFDTKGKLVSSSSAAHGTGTTVKVSDFLKSIPVRKQTALKQATKTLNNVKKLLFDYAFARPTVRFQFKVLKSGGDLKANWSFAPCNDASNLNLLSSKIVGKDVAAQCKQCTVTSDDGGYTIDALLFAKDADISSCGGTDRFVSIDGRPLAAERGLLKDLNKTYRSYISSTLPEGTIVPHKVFLLLRMQCPRGSYDINIEPAKNEVMFEDSGLILELFERLCKMAYGEKTDHVLAKKEMSKKHSAKTTDFELLLANKTPPKILDGKLDGNLKDSHPLEEAQGPRLHERSVCTSGDPKKTKVFRNMYDVDEQDFSGNQNENNVPSEQEATKEAENIMDPRVTNPFVLAKVNTLLKPQKASPWRSSTSTTRQDDVLNGQVPLERDQTITSQLSNHHNLLPSPSPSPERNVPYQNPGPPNRPWKTRDTRDETDEDDASQPINLQCATKSTEPTLLDNWTSAVNSSSPQQDSVNTVEVRRSEPLKVQTRTGSGLVSNSIQRKTPNKRPIGLSPSQRTAFQTPFRKSSNLQSSSPMSGSHSASSYNVKVSAQQVEPVSPLDASNPRYPGFERPRVPPDSELDEIMDFEHRKRSTVLEHRRKTRQPKSNSVSRDDDEIEEGAAFSVPPRLEKERLISSDQNAGYGSKFGAKEDDIDDSGIPQQPNSASYTQNPHWNRYKKALRDLDDRNVARDVAEGNVEVTGPSEADADADDLTAVPHDKDLHERHVKMSLSDPRAYLIRQTKDKPLQGSTSKVKKSVMAKLPFETIEAEDATYTHIGVIHSETMTHVRRLSHQTRMLERIDSYVRNGAISSDITAGTMSKDLLQQWEVKLQGLMGTADSSQPAEPQEGDMRTMYERAMYNVR